MEATLDGSRAAFNELVERYRDKLLRFLITRASSRADAEDAVQDTFISAYRYLESFDSRWRFSTWIYRIAIRNAARQRRPEWHDAEAEVVDEADPLAACIAHSEQENVWLAAKRLLSDDAYNAMWLRYVEDLSVKEISAALEKSPSWTKVTLMRGRQRLSNELTGDESPPARRKSYG